MSQDRRQHREARAAKIRARLDSVPEPAVPEGVQPLATGYFRLERARLAKHPRAVQDPRQKVKGDR